MNASVSGANSRLGSSTWSGKPVECNAEQITGTPDSQAANRPQNILSPPVPDRHYGVNAAALHQATFSRQRTAKSYFCESKPVKEGTSRDNSSPSRSKYLRQQVPGAKRTSVHAADDLRQQPFAAAQPAYS